MKELRDIQWGLRALESDLGDPDYVFKFRYHDPSQLPKSRGTALELKPCNRQWALPPPIRRRYRQRHADFDAGKIDVNADGEFHLHGRGGSHREERLEKCPFATCEYHFKGFARK
jgi:hypothetical protein